MIVEMLRRGAAKMVGIIAGAVGNLARALEMLGNGAGALEMLRILAEALEMLEF